MRSTFTKEYPVPSAIYYAQVHSKSMLNIAAPAQSPVLEIDIFDQPDPVIIGSLFTYTIRLTNNSDVPLTNMTYITHSWANPTPILISASSTATTSNPVVPYPSSILVSGITGQITNTQVALHALSHTLSSDVDILLQGPDGQNATLLSDVGDTWPVNAAMLFFNDTEFHQLPEYGQIHSGTYIPTNYDFPDNFPAPGPGIVMQRDSGLSTFEGGSGNGLWQLYVVDDYGPDEVGAILAGWTLTLTSMLSTPNVLTVQVVIPPQSQLITANGLAWEFTQTNQMLSATRPNFAAFESSLITVILKAPNSPQQISLSAKAFLANNPELEIANAFETTTVVQASSYFTFLPFIQR